MRFLVGLFLLIANFTVQTQAQSLTDIDVKPGYIVAQCKTSGVDTVGALGLVLNKLSSSQTDSTLSLTANSSLYVCTIATDGSKKLAWKVANPYQGFDVQYFHAQTNSVQLRKVFIDPKKSFNRMKLAIFAYSKANNFYSVESSMQESANDSFTGTVQLKKSEILSAADRAELATGKIVKKTIELYHASNFTTIINNEEVLMGDESRSGQSLILHFQQDGQTVRLVKISN